MTRRVLMGMAILVLVLCSGVWAAEPPENPMLRIETGMHTATIRRISVDAANTMLATASDDKTVRLWDAHTGRAIRTIRPPAGLSHEGKIFAVALSPDGKIVAAGGYTQFTGEEGGLAPDGLAIYLFDTGTGRLVRAIAGLPNVINHLIFSPDGQRLAACLGAGNGVRLYHTADGSPAGEDQDYGLDSYGASFGPSGDLVTTCYDGYIRRYDSRFILTNKVKAPGGKEPYGIAFSPDGRHVAVGFNDSTAVNVLSGGALSLACEPDTGGAGNGDLCRVAWSADGKTLYAGGMYASGSRRPIRIWADGGKGGYTDVPVVNNTLMDLKTRKDGGLFFGSYDPAFGALDSRGNPLFSRKPHIADYRDMDSEFQVSADGRVIRFGYEPWGKSPAVFSLSDRSLSLNEGASSTPALAPPRTEATGLAVTDWRNSNLPKLNGRALELEPYERSRCFAIAPDSRSFLLGSDWAVRLFNPEGREIWKVPSPDVAWAVNVSGDGRYALAALGDGTIRWYSMADGREILAFFPHNDQKRWVIWTPEGFFDASEGGAELIGYHLNQGKNREAAFVSVDKLYDAFYRPDLVMAKFRGEDIAEAANAVDVNRLLTVKTLPPVVRFTTTPGGCGSRDAVIEGEICDQGGGVGDVTLILNGMPVVLDKGGRALKKLGSGKTAACFRFAHTLTLSEGNNTLGLTAKNKDNTIDSNRAEIALAFSSGHKQRPDLYILAVAVNQYRDGDLRLKYPISDADELVSSLRSGGKRLFGNVTVKTVYDADATKGGLAAAFRELGAKTKRDDVFVLFIAGHGITWDKDGNYYFLPVDFRYTGDTAVKTQGVSKDDLMGYLTNIQAMKSLVMLDTCNSGSFAEAAGARSIAEKTALSRLSRAVGRSIIAASSRDQSALEGYEGHGVFTWTLLQALSGKAMDKDGKITVNGLATYIEETLPQITYKKWGYEQIPQKSLTGMDFPLVLP